MGLLHSLIAQQQPIRDGRSAWAEFMAGVRSTFEQQADWTLYAGLGLVVAIVIVGDVLLARWIVRRLGRRG